MVLLFHQDVPLLKKNFVLQTFVEKLSTHYNKSIVILTKDLFFLNLVQSSFEKTIPCTQNAEF